MGISAWDTKRFIAKTSTVITVVVIIVIVAVLSQNIFVHLAYAETGKGTDIFKVILTIFGVENTKGDVIALVTVNNGESSRVKFLKTEAFKPISSNMSSLTMTPDPNSNAGILEYVATFPNVTVNSGAEYKACVMTTKDLELLCKTGHNSPASRPEFIDINLDEVTSSGIERLEKEEQQAQIEEQN
jgi:PDZ domain-containing secreted protein